MTTTKPTTKPTTRRTSNPAIAPQPDHTPPLSTPPIGSATAAAVEPVTERPHPRFHYIHLVDGEKGGVGKTLLARAMVQWFIDYEQPFRAVEMDRSNSDLLGVYNEHTDLVILSEKDRLESQADALFNLALEGRTVIADLPAQAFRPITAWIERCDLIHTGAEHGIGIAKWFVSSGGYSSLQLFKATLLHFDGKIPHVLVRNRFLRDNWAEIESNSEFQALVQRYNVPVIDLPQLGYDERDIMDEYRLTFGEALMGNHLHALQKSRVRKFLEAVYSAMESTGLLPVV